MQAAEPRSFKKQEKLMFQYLYKLRNQIEKTQAAKPRSFQKLEK